MKSEGITIPITKNKSITLGSPHRIEFLLLAAYGFLFMWWDLLINKYLLGDYEVEWISGISSQTLDLAIVVLILYHMVLMSLFLMSLRSKATNRTFDVIVGGTTLFGVAIVLAGFVNMVYAESIRFLFIDMPSVNFYHIGVGLQVFGLIYYAVTK